MRSSASDALHLPSELHKHCVGECHVAENLRNTFRMVGLPDRVGQVSFKSLTESPWHQIEGNEAAIAEMAERLALTAKQRAVITFSGLVRGLSFRNPALPGTDRNEIATENGTVLRTLDQALIDSLLLLLSLHSFKDAGIIASALVVPGAAKPSDGFIKSARALLAMSAVAMSDSDLWARELDRVYLRFA